MGSRDCAVVRALASHRCGSESNSTPYVGWVCCWFSSLLREVFLRVLRFSPLLKNQHFQILIRSRFQWTNSHYVEVPLQIPTLFYSKCIRCMFFANSRESPQIFYKLLDILKFDNIVKLSICTLAHKIFNKSSNDSLRSVSSLHKYNTRFASKGYFHQPKVRSNTGKFTFVYVASFEFPTKFHFIIISTTVFWLSCK